MEGDAQMQCGNSSRMARVGIITCSMHATKMFVGFDKVCVMLWWLRLRWAVDWLL